MRSMLPKDFFNRQVTIVARDLVGKYLVRHIGDKTISVMITEVEAYDGLLDLACHASKGRTKRTEVMFGEAGRFYVFFTYGMHWMVNIVTGAKEYPAAILLRGGYYVGPKTKKGMAINGPARLTKFFGIDKTFNGLVASKKSGLWFEDRGFIPKSRDIIKGKRIGVAYAGPIWGEKLWNFKIDQKKLKDAQI